MKTDEIVYRIMADVDQAEKAAGHFSEIAVFMSRGLFDLLEAEYRGFVLLSPSKTAIHDAIVSTLYRPTFCGHPVRVCDGEGLEYFISIRHGVIKEETE